MYIQALFEKYKLKFSKNLIKKKAWKIVDFYLVQSTKFKIFNNELILFMILITFVSKYHFILKVSNFESVKFWKVQVLKVSSFIWQDYSRTLNLSRNSENLFNFCIWFFFRLIGFYSLEHHYNVHRLCPRWNEENGIIRELTLYPGQRHSCNVAILRMAFNLINVREFIRRMSQEFTKYK